MKYLLIVPLLIVFYTQAQDLPNFKSNSKITTIGYWEKGAKCRYKVTRSETKYKANSDKIAKESSESYNLELKIVDSTEHTYNSKPNTVKKIIKQAIQNWRKY